MSGVCGIVRLQPNQRNQDLRNALGHMMAAGAHRGSHGANIHVTERAALGHLWLSVQREGVDEAQPVSSEDGQCWITLDGEIQNTQALRQRLEHATNKQLQQASFPRLLLEAYHLYDVGFLSFVEGIFAGAIWDGRKQQLICFRDRFGIKPLFYSLWQSSFVFASEINQILALPEFKKEPNEEMIADYLCADTSLFEASFFKGLMRVPAGCYLVVRDGAIEKKQYWDIDPAYRVELADDDAYGERFLELLEASVRRNMMSPYVGAALSGGLDSSSIVCLADRIRKGWGETAPMETFSLAFDDKMVDETEHVHAVGAVTNILHNQYRSDDENIFKHLQTVQARQAEPFRSLGIVLFWRLKQLSAAKNIRVMLTGMGADEVLGGINMFYLADFLKSGNWLGLRGALNALVKQDPFAMNYSHLQYLKVFGMRPLLSASVRQQWRRFRGSEIPQYIDPGFAKRANIGHRIVAKHPLVS